MINHILFSKNRMQQYCQSLLADITDADICVQPLPCMNHPAWILGHLGYTLDLCAYLLDPALGDPGTDAARKAAFAPASVVVPDRSKHPSKDELMSGLNTAWDRAADLFTKTSPEYLSREMPDERRRQRFPTIGDAVVLLLTTHNGVHLGQLSAWRRCRGKAPLF